MTNSQELTKYTKGLSILFVEDHDDLRENTTEILQNFFYRVASAENGEKALKIYEQHYKSNQPFDIVLTDIQMPKMDGVTLTQKIYDLHPEQSIIVLSAHDEAKYLLPLINMGISHFIKKPIDYQELINVLLNNAKKIVQKLGASQNNLSDIQIAQNLVYSRDKKMLFGKGESIYLTKYELIFLQLLTADLGKAYSNEEIVETYTEQRETMDAQNIRKLVSKLRKKLPEGVLESIYAVGYRLIPQFL
jgi:DNA-binding response OmpR family regulator